LRSPGMKSEQSGQIEHRRQRTADSRNSQQLWDAARNRQNAPDSGQPGDLKSLECERFSNEWRSAASWSVVAVFPFTTNLHRREAGPG
jgi:hypothetical protein